MCRITFAGDIQKMSPALQFGLFLVDELEIRLMDESCGVHGVITMTLGSLPFGQVAKNIVYLFEEFIDGSPFYRIVDPKAGA